MLRYTARSPSGNGLKTKHRRCLLLCTTSQPAAASSRPMAACTRGMMTCQLSFVQTAVQPAILKPAAENETLTRSAANAHGWKAAGWRGGEEGGGAPVGHGATMPYYACYHRPS